MTRQIKVLSIDDDQDVHDTINETLKGDEFEARNALSAREGLREVLRFQPDIILLDYVMPDVNGYDTIKELKTHNLTRDIPVIVLSSSNDPTVIEGFYQLEAIDFISKPIAPRLLRKKIRSIVMNLKLLDKTPMLSSHSSVIGFFGVKGGVGTSTIAANTALFLAQSLADEGRNVLMLDNNCYYSTTKFTFNVKNRESLFSLLSENPFDLDETTIFERLTRITDNLYVLPSISKMGEFELVREDDFSAILQILAMHFDFIIVDMDRSFSESNLYIFENANAVMLVTNTTGHSLQNMHDTINTLKRIGIQTDKLALVLNMVDKNEKIDEDGLTRYTGVPCVGNFKNLPEKYSLAEENRIPISAIPRSPVAQEYMKLTEAIIDLAPSIINETIEC